MYNLGANWSFEFAILLYVVIKTMSSGFDIFYNILMIRFWAFAGKNFENTNLAIISSKQAETYIFTAYGKYV